jgi:hypothetical protein
LQVLIEAIPFSAYVTVGFLFIAAISLGRAPRLILVYTLTFSWVAQLVFYHPKTPQSYVQSLEGAPLAIPLPRSDYASIHLGAWAQVEADVYWGSIDLLHWVGNVAKASDGRVGFWYSNDSRHSAISSIQSIFLWGYSRVQDWALPSGMPTIDRATLENLKNCRYLVLLGFTKGEIDEGLRSLRSSGIDFIERERREYSGKVVRYEAALVVLQ